MWSKKTNSLQSPDEKEKSESIQRVQRVKDTSSEKKNREFGDRVIDMGQSTHCERVEIGIARVKESFDNQHPHCSSQNATDH